MSKFRVSVWYIGVLLVSVSLYISFITKNWLLTLLCASVTAILKSKTNEVEIPKLYRDKGVSNNHFDGGNKDEKNHK